LVVRANEEFPFQRGIWKPNHFESPQLWPL
jgi:hypothetical protein